MERLQKIIARSGAASRRAAEKLISAGRVTVDGQVVTELGAQADWPRQTVAIDGKPLRAEKKVYIILNKPLGYISSAADEQGRPTVIDLVRGKKRGAAGGKAAQNSGVAVSERIYPVGRLDYDTEGLLLLTNDGELTNALLHPRFEIKKTYAVEMLGNLTKSKLDMLRRGVRLSDGLTAPAKVTILPESKPPNYRLEITIHEGRNRQVRRMIDAIGGEVRSLRRVRFAFLTLKGMQCGAYRHLTAEEVEGLYKLAGLTT